MRESFKTLIFISLIVGFGECYVDNNIPVPGRYTGLTFGKNATGINFEVFYDLLCDAAYANF